MSTTIYDSSPSRPSGYGFTFASGLTYETSSTATTYSVSAASKVKLEGATGTVKFSITSTLTGTSQTSRSTTKTFDNTSFSGNNGAITYLSSKKWTWSKGTSQKTVTVTSTASNSKMSNSVVSHTFTIPALTAYTITYKANGGTGSDMTQTKYAGKSIALLTTGFTRSGYALKGWNTKADGSGTNYQLGVTYTANSNITLYAVWSSLYVISNIKAYRVDSSGEPLRNGTRILVSFDYDTLTTTNVQYRITIGGTVVDSGTFSSSKGAYSNIFSSDPEYDAETEYAVIISLIVTDDDDVEERVIVPPFKLHRTIDLIDDGEATYMGLQTEAEDGKELTLSPDVYIKGHDSPIGSVLTVTVSSVNIAGVSTDWRTVTGCYLDIPAGSWIITYSCYCNVNETGRRLGARLYNTTSGTAYTSSRAIVHTSSASAASVTGGGGYKYSSTNRIQLQAFQTNQSGARPITAYIRAMRIA